MRIDTKKLKRLLLLNFPYIFVGLIATKTTAPFEFSLYLCRADCHEPGGRLEAGGRSEFIGEAAVLYDDAAGSAAESPPQLLSS